MDKQNLTKISKYIKLNDLWHDKRLVVFMVCLLISGILWFLNAMDKDYSTIISYPAKYVNIPENRFLANDPPENFELKVNAHGFTLLRHKLNLSFTPIIIDIERMIRSTVSANNMTFNISEATLISRISSQISSEIRIYEINPRPLILILDSLDSKQVPISQLIDIEFDSQYNISSEIQIIPKFATITGPGILLNDIDTIYTETKKINKAKKPVDITLDLIFPEKITISPEEVIVKIPVEEFTEKIISVPVKIKNKPTGVDIKLFPSEVKVSFMVGLSYYSKLTDSDFQFSVPYSEITEDKKVLQIHTDRIPDFITNLKYMPTSFEYLIENK